MATIVIKNVTGSSYNNWCIWELKRAGYPEGTVMENVSLDEKQSVAKWGDCVAYVGETCELVTVGNFNQINNINQSIK